MAIRTIVVSATQIVVVSKLPISHRGIRMDYRPSVACSLRFAVCVELLRHLMPSARDGGSSSIYFSLSFNHDEVVEVHAGFVKYCNIRKGASSWMDQLCVVSRMGSTLLRLSESGMRKCLHDVIVTYDAGNH